MTYNPYGTLLQITTPIRNWKQWDGINYTDQHVEYYFTQDHAVTHLPALEGNSDFAACGATRHNHPAYALSERSNYVCLRCVNIYRIAFKEME